MSTLTNEQNEALQAINRWLGGVGTGKWMFTLAGYAGTGKTYLLQHLINENNSGPKKKLYCCAPTGKAASVLQRKLNDAFVSTIHRLLYIPIPKARQKLISLEMELAELKLAQKDTAKVEAAIHVELEKLSKEKTGFSSRDDHGIEAGDIIIVDEASMVTEKMMEDFRRTGAKVLFVGDPAQLPPINSRNWFLEATHDAMLKSIQRQALESPILRLSMEIREGTVRLSDYNYPDCRIITKDQIDHEEWLAADQILTGSNDSRQRINRFTRKKRFPEANELPVKGEKLICLKNDFKHKPIPFINGTQFICEESAVKNEDYDWPIIAINYEGQFMSRNFYPFFCHHTYNSRLKVNPRDDRDGLLELDFAYAITVHKSQGSEWSNVIIADDRMKEGDRDFRKKWFYTAVTRAKEKLTIVK